MSNQKKELQVSIVSENPSLLSKVLEPMESVKEQADFVLAVLKRLDFDYDKRGLIVSKTIGLDAYVHKVILHESPSYIKFMVAFQTEELCDLAVSLEHKSDPHNIVTLFSEVKKQTLASATLAISGDARCYKYIEERFMSPEIDMLAVKADSWVIREIKGYHSPALAEAAVMGWAKAVQWINCEDPDVQERLQLVAIEANLQAMPSPKGAYVSQRVKDRFKALCIENNYFDEDWCPLFNLTQSQVYSMLSERRQWIESHRIFKLLDDAHKLKALKEGLMHYRIPVTVDDLLKVVSTELLSLLLTLSEVDVRVKYFQVASVSIVEKVVSLNGELLEYVPQDKHTEVICLAAVDNTPKALGYVKSWTDALYARLQSIA
jgi:hypothetical protein